MPGTAESRTTSWLDSRRVAVTLAPACRGKEAPVLWTIFVVLLVLWLLGFFAFHVTSGFIHLVLVVAVIVLVLGLVRRGP
jgi:hypothetical protein